jgi:hypothetical protein
VPKRPKDLLTALLKRFLEALAPNLVLATASAQPAAPSSTIAPSTAPATPAASAVPVGTQANQAPPVIPSHITVEMKSPPASGLGTWSAILVAIIAALASIGAAIYAATAAPAGSSRSRPKTRCYRSGCKRQHMNMRAGSKIAGSGRLAGNSRRRNPLPRTRPGGCGTYA